MQAVTDGYANATAENGPWMLGLDQPSYVAVVTYADNRCVPRLAASLKALDSGETPGLMMLCWTLTDAIED